MKRFSLLLMAVAIAIALGPVRGTRGQTPSPTPTGTVGPSPSPVATVTATVTSIVPTGEQLLGLMAAAVLAKNSFHVTTSIDVAFSHRRLADTAGSDQKLSPVRVHTLETAKITDITVKPNKKSIQHYEMVVVNKKRAVRLGKEPWKCGKATPAASSSGVGSAFSSTTSGVRIQSVQNLGQRATDGTAVWDVQAVITLTLSKKRQTITFHFYISQADNTLVADRTAVTLTVLGEKVQEKLAERYSNYGEPVSVKLPTKCAKSKASADAPAVFQNVGFGSLRDLPNGFAFVRESLSRR